MLPSSSSFGLGHNIGRISRPRPHTENKTHTRRVQSELKSVGGEFPCPDDEAIPANANGCRIVCSGPAVCAFVHCLTNLREHFTLSIFGFHLFA